MKRLLASLTLLLVALAFLPFPGRAAEPSASQRARAALRLAAAARQRAKAGKCGCSGPGDCTCAPGACSCPQCAAPKSDAYEVSLFDSAGTTVVCKTKIDHKDGDDWPSFLDCCGKRFTLRSLDWNHRAPWYGEYVPVPVFQPAPQFFAPPPMTFRGGPGGGFRRGGGGGC